MLYVCPDNRVYMQEMCETVINFLCRFQFTV